MIIANFEVRRVLVDHGSSVDIIFIDAFNKLDMPMEEVGPFHSALVGFAGEQVRLRGHIELTTFVGIRTISIKFLIVEWESRYNAILRKRFTRQNQYNCVHPHLTMKFPLLNGQVRAIHVN